jgi:hypothetical protein
VKERDVEKIYWQSGGVFKNLSSLNDDNRDKSEGSRAGG